MITPRTTSMASRRARDGTLLTADVLRNALASVATEIRCHEARPAPQKEYPAGTRDDERREVAPSPIGFENLEDLTKERMLNELLKDETVALDKLWRWNPNA